VVLKVLLKLLDKTFNARFLKIKKTLGKIKTNVKNVKNVSVRLSWESGK